MVSDAEIKTKVFQLIKGSELEKSVTGKLSKKGRPYGSNLEDIVISVLDGGSGEIQEFIVNVNIYVADTNRGTYYEEDTVRIETLSKIAISLFEVYNGSDYRCTLETQRTYQVDGRDEHCINNKISIKQINI